MRRAIAIRMTICMIVGLLAAVLLSEIGFSLQDTTSRPPKTVELVIPSGAREMALRREAILPESMVFVVGDVVVVRNQDTVAHTFGPLYIPPGSSASLALNQAENLSYLCSFQPSQAFGLDVREPLTLSTRLQGVFLAGVPMGLLLAVYSLVVWPMKPKKAAEQDSAD